MVVIEMNPRVSRSSALASKATGFPIAKIAAKLAVGYTLDEIPNDITKADAGLASSRSIDYVVTKIPRWAFEKLPGDQPGCSARSMQSVGEVDGHRPDVPGVAPEGPVVRWSIGQVRAELRLRGRASSFDELDRLGASRPCSAVPTA